MWLLLLHGVPLKVMTLKLGLINVALLTPIRLIVPQGPKRGAVGKGGHMYGRRWWRRRQRVRSLSDVRGVG
jgi:hypothetical protein